MERFPDRQIIQFPQSIHYSSPERIEQSKRAIGRHKNFVLLVRDEESKEFSEKHFDCTVRLCPDMAFAIGPLPERATQIPVLAMLREDAERVGGTDRTIPSDIPVEDWITESKRKVDIAKRLGVASAYLALKPSEVALRRLDAAAHNRFERGISQISRARAIVTDRLHVHICSLLLGRPHVDPVLFQRLLDRPPAQARRRHLHWRRARTFLPASRQIDRQANDLDRQRRQCREAFPIG